MTIGLQIADRRLLEEIIARDYLSRLQEYLLIFYLDLKLDTSLDHSETRVAMAEATGQFGNPNGVEFLPLEAGIRRAV